MLEAKIEALTVATDKQTAVLTEMLAALQGNTAMLTTMNDGRAEALAALTSSDAQPKTTTRSRKKADAEPVASAPAETVQQEEPAGDDEGVKGNWSPDLSADGLRAAFTPYLTGTSDDAEKKVRIANVQAILAELGAQSINPAEGKTHLESDDDRRKAVFFVTRFNAGLPVDFKADYDFNVDPLTQDAPASGGDDLIG